jgi:hypothetical protein
MCAMAVAGCLVDGERDAPQAGAPAMSKTSDDSLQKGTTMPPLGPGGRNALVSVAEEAGTPEQDGEGVAIAIRGTAPGGAASAPVGEEIRLLGRAVAGDELSRRCGASPLMGVFVTVIRTDGPWGMTLPVRQPLAMTAEATPPPDDEPARPNRRTSVTFAFDLRRFFDLPMEPGTYSVRAHLGPYESARLRLEVVKKDGER